MSKTPYEIRLELLKLSKEVLFEPVYQTRNDLMQEYHSKMNTDNSIPLPVFPEFPDSDRILAEAEKLNKFVSQG